MGLITSLRWLGLGRQQTMYSAGPLLLIMLCDRMIDCWLLGGAQDACDEFCQKPCSIVWSLTGLVIHALTSKQ